MRNEGNKMAFAATAFIIVGVLLCVNQHKGWGWSLIVLGALVAIGSVL